MTIPQETTEVAEQAVGNDGTADDELEEFFAKKSRAKKGKKKKKANVRLEDLEEELELQAAQQEIEEDPQLALMLHRMEMEGQKSSSPEKPRDTQSVVAKQWGQPVMVATSVEDAKFVPRAKKQLDIDDPKAFPSIEEVMKREARKAAEKRRVVKHPDGGRYVPIRYERKKPESIPKEDGGSEEDKEGIYRPPGKRRGR